MRTHLWISLIGLGWSVLSWGRDAEAQAPARFQVPPQYVAMEETGTLEGFQGDIVRVRDSKSEAWWLKVSDATKISVKGDAEEECLKTGIFVQLTGQIDKKNMLAEPVTEVEIIALQGKPSVGLFTASEASANEDEGAKPVKNAGPGKYRIRGKLALFRDGEIVVLAGNRKITGDVAEKEKFKVKVNLNDLSVVQEGDEVEIKAWYRDPFKPAPLLDRPGQALAEEIKVNLAKRLAPAGKKPSRPAARSKSATKN